MKIYEQLGVTVIVVAGVIASNAGGPHQPASIQQAKAGIERLHQQDVEATLTDKADELAKLWDNEAVRIQLGRPAEIGKAVIYENDKRWEAKVADPRLFVTNQKSRICKLPEIGPLNGATSPTKTLAMPRPREEKC
jgi:hypothetical protein